VKINSGVTEGEAVGFSTDGKAKYFDVWRHSFRILGKLVGDATKALGVRQEIHWLAALIERTIDARTRSWKKPIKKLRDATFLKKTSLSNRKKHDLRSSMCQFRPQAEKQLQEKFLGFLQAINCSPPAEFESACKVWRRGVVDVLANELRAAVVLSTPGSPLRRQEAMMRVDDAIREAVRLIAIQDSKPADKLKSETRKRGEE